MMGLEYKKPNKFFQWKTDQFWSADIDVVSPEWIKIDVSFLPFPIVEDPSDSHQTSNFSTTTSNQTIKKAVSCWSFFVRKKSIQTDPLKTDGLRESLIEIIIKLCTFIWESTRWEQRYIQNRNEKLKHGRQYSSVVSGWSGTMMAKRNLSPDCVQFGTKERKKKRLFEIKLCKQFSEPDRKSF